MLNFINMDNRLSKGLRSTHRSVLTFVEFIDNCPLVTLFNLMYIIRLVYN